LEWKANNTSANGAFLKAWINGNQVLNDVGSNTVPGGGDDVRSGCYNDTISNGGDVSRSGREPSWRFYHLVEEAGYTLDQIMDLLK
jgi:hypothetical protein